MLHPLVALLQLALIVLVGRTFALVSPTVELPKGNRAKFSSMAASFFRTAAHFTLGSAILCFVFSFVGFVWLDGRAMTALAVALALPGALALFRVPFTPEAPDGPDLSVASDKRTETRGRTRADAVVSAMILVMAGIGLWGCFSPEVRSDAILYHLSVPKLWLNFGRIVDIPEQGLSYYPYGFEMLYAWSMSLGSDSAAKVLHWAAGLSAALWCARIASTLGVRPILCAAVFYFVPVVNSLSTTAFIDLATAMYALAALGLWFESGPGQAQSYRAVTLIGFFLGSAFATKYPAWPLLGPPFAALALVSWRRSPVRFSIFALVALLPLLPWVARNFAYTGNPLAPLLIDSLGPEYARGSDLHSFMSFLSGRDSGILRLALSPFLYARHLFYENYLLALFGPLCAVPYLLRRFMGGLRKSAEHRLVFAAALLVPGMYWLEAVSTQGNPTARYGLATMGLGGCLVVRLLGSGLSERRRGTGGDWAVYAFVGLSFVNALIARHWDEQDLGEELRPILSEEARVGYLIERGFAPPDFAAIEAHLSEEKADRVIGARYPSDTKYWRWTFGGRNLLVERAGGRGASPQQILESLRVAGVTHILDALNPGFDEKNWTAFMVEYTDPTGSPEWRLRGVGTAGTALRGRLETD